MNSVDMIDLNVPKLDWAVRKTKRLEINEINEILGYVLSIMPVFGFISLKGKHPTEKYIHSTVIRQHSLPFSYGP